MELNVCANYDTNNEQLLTQRDVDEIVFQLPSDIIGGELPSYYLGTFVTGELPVFIEKVKNYQKKFVYNMNATCLGNLEFIRKNHKELTKLLDLLRDNGAYGVRICSPFLLDIMKKNYPSLQITVENVRNFSEAKFYVQKGVKNLSLLSICNRNFRLLEELIRKMDAKIELSVNDFELTSSPIYQHKINSNGHASQSCHQNEGFTLAYYEAKEWQNRLSDRLEFIKAGWIRPEDLYLYENMGIKSFKIKNRNFLTNWLNNTVAAYSNRSFGGNLMDLLNTYRADQTQKLNSMVIKRPDLAHSGRCAEITKVLDSQQVYLDNTALSGFLSGIKDHNLDCEYCFGCGYCKNFADKALTISPQWWIRAEDRISKYLNNITSGAIFDEDDNYRLSQMNWRAGVDEICEKIVLAKPNFVHDIAREGIRNQAEKYALERNSKEVELADVVRANLSETPEVFRGESIKQMRSLGLEPNDFVNVSKYVKEEDTTAANESISDKGSPYKNKDTAWKVISAFLTKINDSEEGRKAIPKGKITEIQYKITDLNLNYVERIGKSKIEFDRKISDSPDVTLTMDSRTYHEIMGGEIHPVQASESKRSIVDGPIFKLIKIQNVLTQINKIYPGIAESILANCESDNPKKKETGEGNRSPIKNGNQAWELINAFLSKINEDPTCQKFIPTGKEVKIQYRLPDINFDYVESIGNKKITYEKGTIDSPDVTLTMDSLTYHEIMGGKIHPVQASEAKRSRVDGPVFKLIKIQNVLTQINKIYPDIAARVLQVSA